MKAVVGTSVAPYPLLSTEGFLEEARACFGQVAKPMAPAHSEAEIAT